MCWRRVVLCALGACASSRASTTRGAAPAECDADATERLDALDESISVRPLGSDVLVHVNLTARTDAVDVRAMGHFPRAIADLALLVGLAEFRLTASSATWRDAWGPSPEPAPPGAQLEALLRDDVDGAWALLREALAGLICPAAARMRELTNAARTARFARTAPTSPGLGNFFGPLGSFLGAEPAAAPCAFEFDRALALWPCAAAAGPSALLAPASPLRAAASFSRYSSLGLHVSHGCAGGLAPANSPSNPLTSCRPRLEMRISWVGVVGESGAGTEPIAEALGVLHGPARGDEGGPGLRACPLARTSVVHVALPEAPLVDLTPPPLAAGTVATEPRAWHPRATWHLDADRPLPRISARWRGGVSATAARDAYVRSATTASRAPLHAERRLLGAGDVDGALVLTLRNAHVAPTEVRVFDALHWPLVPHWHTLRLRVNGTAAPPDAHLTELVLAPSASRGEPSALGWAATIPPDSEIDISIGYEKSLLHVDEAPADGSRGVEAGAAAIRYREAASVERAEPGPWAELWTDAALMPIGAADPAMPYNVVAISSTLVALFVSSILNLLTRPLRRD